MFRLPPLPGTVIFGIFIPARLGNWVRGVPKPAETAQDLANPRSVGGNAYTASLVTLAPVLPLFAAILTVVFFLVDPEKPDPTGKVGLTINTGAIVAGLVAALALWLMLGILRRWSATSEGTNMRVYGDLIYEFTQLDSRINTYCPERRTRENYGETVDPMAASAACLEAWEHRDFVSDCLNSGRPDRDSPWKLSANYIALWNSIHRAEEALFIIEPVGEVVRHAIADEVRLESCDIDKDKRLTTKLAKALRVISPGAVQYLSNPMLAAPIENDANKVQPHPAQARAVIREVRKLLNSFRDDKWEGLVREYDNLMKMLCITGCFLYGLVLLAIANRLPHASMLGAAVFFVVGGTVGLLREIQKAGETPSSEEDLGLKRAQLIAVPLFSGLAALGGVLFVALLPALMPEVINSATLNPDNAQTAGTLLAQLKDLTKIFDVEKNVLGLVVAATFGLTPALLFNSLQRRIAADKKALKSAEAP